MQTRIGVGLEQEATGVSAEQEQEKNRRTGDQELLRTILLISESLVRVGVRLRRDL